LSNEATYTQISLDEARKHMAYHRKTDGKLLLSEEPLDFIRDEDIVSFCGSLLGSSSINLVRCLVTKN